MQTKTTVSKSGVTTVTKYAEVVTDKKTGEKTQILTITKGDKTYALKQTLDENNHVSKKERYATTKQENPVSITYIERDSSGKATSSVEIIYDENNKPTAIKVSSYNNGTISKKEKYECNDKTPADVNNKNYSTYLGDLQTIYTYDKYGNFLSTQKPEESNEAQKADDADVKEEEKTEANEEASGATATNTATAGNEDEDEEVEE